MSSLYIHSGNVYNTDTKSFEKANIIIRDGFICDIEKGEVKTSGYDKVIDASGKFVAPAYIDIHTHGALLHKFYRETPEEMIKLLPHYASTGVATVFPTTASDTFDNHLESTTTIRKIADTCDDINIDCYHYEGPFLSDAKRGAHNPALLCKPDIEFIKKAIKILGDIKIRVTVAPELDGAFEFIRECKKLGVMTAIGHTNADFDTCVRAVECGADSFIHTFNAMSPLQHREPGAVGAAMYCDDAYAELICDGVHVNKYACAILYRIKKEKLVLITDSIQAAGVNVPENTEFGSADFKTKIVNGQARLPDGTLAGSRLDMHTAVHNLSEFANISFGEALYCATASPAKLCGIFDKTGSIAVGKRADINILSDKYELNDVFVKGKKVL